MRRNRLKINKALGLREIKEDLRAMLKDHHTLALKNLDETANDIFAEASALVPIQTGELQDSIQVTVSRSSRYPGVIATAEAHNVRTGYDYALMQEVREDYHHEIGQAHFLEEPFRKNTELFFKRMGW